MKSLVKIGLAFLLLAGPVSDGHARESTHRSEAAMSRHKMLARLRELQATDFSKLSSAERTKIREEVLSYRKKTQETPLILLSSVGVLILILCVIILQATSVFN